MSMFGDVLGALATAPVGRNRRVSSNEQPNWNDGNFDVTPLAPGEVFELPVLEGPGVIHHIWFTSYAGGFNELNALSLRIYFDGRKEPAVEVPLGDFFAVGQTPSRVDSFPVQVSASGSLTCYWRMPFARSARIVVTNDNLERSSGLYWQVDWIQLDELPPDTPHFHARYRQEYPAVMGRDYLIADLEGKGRYVGTVLSVTMAQAGWFGEGDDFFYIDGEAVPSLQGTGSEDYFNDAWGFRTRSSLWFGQPRWSGFEAGDSGVCYRWHILDPVGFSRSLKLTMEHKGNRPDPTEAWFIERPDFLSSIAYWYQLGEAKSFGSLPAYPERCVPWKERHLVPSFGESVVRGEGELSVRTVGHFGGRPALRFKAKTEGTTVTLPFSVSEQGRFAVRLLAFASRNHGVYDVHLDGNPILEGASFESEEYRDVDLLLGSYDLLPGEHALMFRALAGPGGQVRPLTLEKLRLLKLPTEARRTSGTHNEAHHIQLGIGRAVYAYRLAHGALPFSLEVLVETGILPSRFLEDENGYPLRSQIEGDSFGVESTAPEGWKRRWSGLDARR